MHISHTVTCLWSYNPERINERVENNHIITPQIRVENVASSSKNSAKSVVNWGIWAVAWCSTSHPSSAGCQCGPSHAAPGSRNSFQNPPRYGSPKHTRTAAGVAISRWRSNSLPSSCNALTWGRWTNLEPTTIKLPRSFFKNWGG